MRARLLVALLIEGRIAAEIDGLRRAFGSAQLDRIPPHITLIPPTNVAFEDLDRASEAVVHAAASTPAFTLSIGPGATFPDNTSVLFLRVGASPELAAFRQALAVGPFALRETERAFVPHVTIDSRREPFVSAAELAATAGYRVRVPVGSVDLLVQADEVVHRPWERRANFALGPPVTIGRGGLEVHLSTGELVGDLLVQLARVWGELGATDGDGGERYCLAELSGRPVGLITWRVSEDVVTITRHVVDPAHRGEGIGTKLLSFVESGEPDRDRRRVVIAVSGWSAAERYYAGRGYLASIELARDTQKVVLVRSR